VPDLGDRAAHRDLQIAGDQWQLLPRPSICASNRGWSSARADVDVVTIASAIATRKWRAMVASSPGKRRGLAADP
jgi:uncharacterized protein involved in outer membrane biogenesis